MNRVVSRRSMAANPLVLGISLLAGLAIVSMPLLAIAQRYVPPPRGIPGRREGAGTRGAQDTCLAGSTQLMPLIPSDRYSTTVSKAPVFFVSVPKTSAKTGEFRLLDAGEQELFVETLPLNGQTGVISYRLPPQAAALLQTGKDYGWQFSLICSSEPSGNPFVEGVIRRTPPSPKLMQGLSKAQTTSDRASVYAAAGIWQDAIATLAKGRCDRPTDPGLQTSWHALLTSVGLADFAQQPLTKSCAALKTSE